MALWRDLFYPDCTVAQARYGFFGTCLCSSKIFVGKMLGACWENQQKRSDCASDLGFWSREPDLNRRPPGYEPGELPDCSIPHCYNNLQCLVIAKHKKVLYRAFPSYARKNLPSHKTSTIIAAPKAPQRPKAHQLRHRATHCATILLLQQRRFPHGIHRYSRPYLPGKDRRQSG